MQYARAWKNDVALWGWGIQTEKDSPFLWQSYGTQLMEARRYPEAIEALNRALELKIEGGTYLALGKTYYEMGRYDEAEREFRRVYDRYIEFNHYPQEFYFCVALLADILNKQRGDVDGAIELFERLAEVMPASRAIAFDHIAEICIQHQMFDRALQYLLKGEPLIESSYAPKARLILFRLGQVYARQGRLDEASIKFGAFLSATANLDDDVIRTARQVAEDSISAIHRLKHGPSPSPKASP